MNRVYKTLLQSIFLLLISIGVITKAHSADRYWVANGPGMFNWDNPFNWSATSGGLSGASVPTSTDDIFFDFLGQGDCLLTIAAPVQIRSITVSPGYSGIIDQGAFAFTVSGSANFSGGYFIGGSDKIEFQSGFILNGSNFTATTGTLLIYSDVVFTSGTFSHNNGLVRFEQGGALQSISGNFIFKNLEIAGPYSTTTINSNLQINGNLLFDSTDGSLAIDGMTGVVITVNGNTSTSFDTEYLLINTITLDVKGNFTQNNNCACGGGSSIIKFSGTGDQVFSSSAPANTGYLPSIIINKPSGDLTLGGILTITGTEWTYVSGNVIPSASTVIFSRENASINGDQTFYHLIINPFYTTLTIADDIIVNGNLTIDGSTDNTVTIDGSVVVNGTLTFNGDDDINLQNGTIHAKGDIYAKNIGPGAGGSATLQIDGATDQYFDGSATPGTGRLPNITISKPSGKVTLGPNTISYSGTWNYVSGIVDASTNSSTINLVNSSSQVINAPAAFMSFHNFSVSLPFRTLTLQSNIDFNGSVTIGTETNLNTSTSNYSVNIGGDLILNTNGTLTSNSSTVIFDGSGNQSLNAPSALTLHKVSINKPAGLLTLQRTLNINNMLTLTNGTIKTTSANILQMNNGSSCNIGNSNSYIDGPMGYLMASASTRSLNFPVGKSGSWRPTVLSVTHSTGAPANYTAELIATSALALGYTLDATLDKVSEVRYWQIDRAGAANLTNSIVQLFYQDEGVNDFTNLTVAKTNGTGTHWFDIGGTATANGTGNILSGSFTSFSKFALANKIGSGNALPITLISFKGRYSEISNSVTLNWQTLTEINNDYFVLQRLSEGEENFVDEDKIESLNETGSSHEKLNYEFELKNPPPGNNYFRLKQIDFDGNSTYSNIINVKVNSAGYWVYPNPVINQKITIHVPSSKSNSSYHCSLTDLNGVNVFSKVYLATQGDKNKIEVEFDQKIANGTYLLKVISRSDSYTALIVVK